MTVILHLCSCGMAADSDERFEDHLDRYPAHYEMNNGRRPAPELDDTARRQLAASRALCREGSPMREIIKAYLDPR
ncbi:MAG: hypothetical protein ACRDPY_24190 [Streptosporangiaceae bacterium]